MNAMRDIENQRSNLEVDAQNNRHPVRGEVFITDFKGAAVETDLTRIALGYAKDNMVPQSHTDLTGVVDRFFDGKPAKKGTSYSGYRDEFPNHLGELREPTNLALNDKGVPERTYTPDDETEFVPKKGHTAGQDREGGTRSARGGAGPGREQTRRGSGGEEGDNGSWEEKGSPGSGGQRKGKQPPQQVDLHAGAQP